MDSGDFAALAGALGWAVTMDYSPATPYAGGGVIKIADYGSKERRPVPCSSAPLPL